MSADAIEMRDWIGRQEICSDVISPVPAAALSATLNYEKTLAKPGAPLPPAWHWLYFLSTPRASTLAGDGHPVRGGFLPPVTLPRRMWAGSKIHFVLPLLIGDEIRRVSTISDVQYKTGNSGELVFVTVDHEIFRGDSLAITEQQSLVYREAKAGSSGPQGVPAPAEPQWSRRLLPDAVLLFRYSAITFNSHRIHYDSDYAVHEEGYRGLVVQGPLTATLLLDLLQEHMPGVILQSFRFRALRPIIAGESLDLQGRCDGSKVQLWALDSSGALAMNAQAQL